MWTVAGGREEIVCNLQQTNELMDDIEDGGV